MAITRLNNNSITSVTALPFSVGIVEADMWRQNTSTASGAGANADISANWERVDTTGFSVLGTGMTQSSGIFTFPSTGIWQVHFHLCISDNGGTTYFTGSIHYTSNNSSYSTASSTETYINTGGSTNYTSATTMAIFDITDTANQKIKFKQDSNADVTIIGSTSINQTHASFVKLSDT